MSLKELRSGRPISAEEAADTASEALASVPRRSPFVRAQSPGDDRDDVEADESRPSFPVELHARYHEVELIGQGGMGSVYKALDPRLGRYVAIKFIHINTPDHVERLFHEARAQARVEHPNICKVYEVGELHGQPFIVMQYISGQPLHREAPKLTLEQRVSVIQSVAEGLHAAHKLGLIHRDIKPANILVERTPEGELRPYVADFGLARDVATDKSTIHGLEGTPSYMSPEQLSGSLRLLDRRTDVYSLGATAYEILVGWPPFPDDSLADILWKIAHELPTPPRKLVKRIPRDLDTIVLKCLEKEPDRRYDSARALAEDLGRFLAGEPIAARPPSFFYQAFTRAKKHRLAVLLFALGLLTVVFLGVVAVRARMRATEEAEVAQHVGALAQRFGQDIKEMELFLRYIYALPIHDITAEKQATRARMGQIERQMADMRATLGDLAVGPGKYALGRGYLALEELDDALAHLEQARLNGYKAPEASFALGIVHGMLYRREVGRASRLADKQVSAAHQRKVEEAHLKPAILYLKEAMAADATRSPYAEALIALDERRLDDALKYATDVLAQSPWLYEAKVLEGDVYSTRAAEARDSADHARALADYSSAVSAYEQASQMARSDPAVYEAEAEAWLEIMRIQALSDSDTQAAFGRAIKSCNDAILIEPRHGEAYLNKAWAYVHQARQLLSRGADPSALLVSATQAGHEAVRWTRGDATAYDALGASQLMVALYDGSLGLDTRSSLQVAIENMERSLALDPDLLWARNDVGLAYGLMAEYEASHGGEPLSSFESSVANLQQAIDANPSAIEYLVNLGWFSAQWAQYDLDHGADPEASLARALDALESSLLIRKDSYQSYNNLGLTYLIQGRHQRVSGEGAEVSFSRALSSYLAAVRINADDLEARAGVSFAEAELASLLVDGGSDPAPALDEGKAFAASILRKKPDDAKAQQALGELALVAARWAERERRSPDAFFAEAERAIRRELAQGGSEAAGLGRMARLYRLRGEWALRSGASARRSAAAGLSSVKEALSSNPRLPWIAAEHGALCALEARAAGTRDARVSLARTAEVILDNALRDNPFLKHDYGSILDEVKKLSTPEPAAGDATPPP